MSVLVQNITIKDGYGLTWTHEDVANVRVMDGGVLFVEESDTVNHLYSPGGWREATVFASEVTK